MQVVCPKCGELDIISDGSLGKTIQCSKCRKEFKAAPGLPSRANIPRFVCTTCHHTGAPVSRLMGRSILAQMQGRKG